MTSPGASLHESDLKTLRRPVVLGGTALALLTFQTLGTIYSDIGTSPLYVLNGIWPGTGSAPSGEDVIGGISAILWSLTILPLLKYVSNSSLVCEHHPSNHLSMQVIVCNRFGTVEGKL